MTKQYICAGIMAVGSAIASMFGGWNASLTTLLIFMAFDYFTGFRKAASPESYFSL